MYHERLVSGLGQECEQVVYMQLSRHSITQLCIDSSQQIAAIRGRLDVVCDLLYRRVRCFRVEPCSVSVWWLPVLVKVTTRSRISHTSHHHRHEGRTAFFRPSPWTEVKCFIDLFQGGGGSVRRRGELQINDSGSGRKLSVACDRTRQILTANIISAHIL